VKKLKIISMVLLTMLLIGCKNNHTIEVELITDEGTENSETAIEEIVSEENETFFWEKEEYSYIIKPEEEQVFHYDIDSDNEDESIIFYASEPVDKNCFPDTRMKIIDGDKVLFETVNFFDGLSSETNSYMYFIVEEDGKKCLLEFCDTSHMGNDVRTFKVIEFLQDGTSKVIKEGRSDLSTSHIFNTDTDVEDSVNLFKNVMSYLMDNNTILLFDLERNYDDMIYSTDDSIKSAEERFEGNIFYDAIEFEGNDVSEFREKIYDYCEIWVKTQNGEFD